MCVYACVCSFAALEDLTGLLSRLNEGMCVYACVCAYSALSVSLNVCECVCECARVLCVCLGM